MSAPRFIIDANLPYYFSIWSGDRYVHVFDINDRWKDSQIWEYARVNNLVIVSKDSDFSDRVMLHEPPPRVVHIRIGNMKMKEFYQCIASQWKDVCDLIESCRLVNVFSDRIEGIL